MFFSQKGDAFRTFFTHVCLPMKFSYCSNYQVSVIWEIFTNLEKPPQGLDPWEILLVFEHTALEVLLVYEHTAILIVLISEEGSEHKVGEPPTSPNFKKTCILFFAKIPFAHIHIYIYIYIYIPTLYLVLLLRDLKNQYLAPHPPSTK